MFRTSTCWDCPAQNIGDSWWDHVWHFERQNWGIKWKWSKVIPVITATEQDSLALPSQSLEHVFPHNYNKMGNIVIRISSRAMTLEKAKCKQYQMAALFKPSFGKKGCGGFCFFSKKGAAESVRGKGRETSASSSYLSDHKISQSIHINVHTEDNSILV